jgi:integrase
VQRLKREASWRGSTLKRNTYALAFFRHIDGVAVGAINADVARAARDFVEQTQKPASANRIMAVFRQVLRACVKWGWLTHAPPVPMVRIEEREPAIANVEQCQRLIAELPEHTRAPALFSILTGMRLGNTRDLTWDRVDLERGRVTVPSSHYKGKRAMGFDLVPEAVALLRSQEGKHATHVFTYQGEPITGTFNTRAFRNARKRAGLHRLRWHDLRHTFASWLAASGASELLLMQAGGWTSTRMPARYAHLRAGDTRPYLLAVGANVAAVVSEVVAAESAQVTDQQVVPGRGLEPPTRALRMRSVTKRR